MLILANRSGPPTDKSTTAGRKLRVHYWLVAAALIICPGRLFAAELRDMFSDRETVDTESGLVTGDNLTATLESGEPRHGERSGGASVWLSWVAPTNCVVTFRTTGSSFDTVLAAYFVEDGDPHVFSKLHPAAENDDEHGDSSAVTFGAYAGRRYEIAVDGYRGARGTVRLAWSVEVVGELPPIILSTSGDQALQEGAPLALGVTLQNASSFELNWYLNGTRVPGQESATLHIPALTHTNLGQYRLRLKLGEFKMYSKSIEIQINSEGFSDSLARDKIYDAVGSAVGINSVAAKPRFSKLDAEYSIPRTLDAVNRGYNGSQIFNTITATTASDEPAICGQSGAVVWFAYQPPESGTLMLNTDGSEVGAAIAVFTYPEPLVSLAQLETISCDSPPPNGSVSELECAVLAGRSYVVGIVGAGDLRGVVKLNYQLDLTRTPVAPSVHFGGAELTVSAGRPLVLAATALGSPPLHFTWLKNGAPLVQPDAGALIIPAALPTDAGTYSVRVRNHIAEAQGGALAVRVLIPPSLQMDAKSGKVILSFETVHQQSYSLEYRDPSGSDVWLPWVSALPGNGGTLKFTNDPPSSSDAWFRVRVQ